MSLRQPIEVAVKSEVNLINSSTQSETRLAPSRSMIPLIIDFIRKAAESFFDLSHDIGYNALPKFTKVFE